MRLSLPFIHQAFRPALTGTGNRSAFHGGKFDNMVDQSFIVVHELTEDFDLENELFEDEDDLMILSAVSCFMRRDLNRIQDYFEVTVPSYAPSEFPSHFRMTRGTCEILCREIMSTGRFLLEIPEGGCLFLLSNKCWHFYDQWQIKNLPDSSPIGLIITMSSVDRVLHRGIRALADISAEYIKWPNGTCFYLWILFVCLFLFLESLFLSDIFVIMNVFTFESSCTYILSAHVYHTITLLHGLIYMQS